LVKSSQLSFLGPAPNLPEGLRYQSDWLPPEGERELAGRFADLPFKPFEFQGYLGKRRVVSFGWQYDFNTMQVRRAEDMPDFLLPLRDSAAAFAGLAASDLQHVLFTEYAPGAGIGWHKDRSVFADVVGISLVSACVFRLRRKKEKGWERASFTAEPRSIYVLQGAARTEWEHSIPAVNTLRYSITFRNLRA
jgi:alkylated DNA repair dioxygenase AlkB